MASSEAIRKEIESGIDFQGTVHALVCGPEHCCFACDRYLYVWPVFAEQPLPELELPFAPATLAIHETRLLAISSDAIVVLQLGDDIVTEEALLAPRGTALFPVMSSSCFSRCGKLAVAHSANSNQFLVISGFEASPSSSDGLNTLESGGLVSQMYTIESPPNLLVTNTSYSAASFIIEHVAFGTSHLYLVSRSGQVAACPIDRFFGVSAAAGGGARGRGEDEDGDADYDAAVDTPEVIHASTVCFSQYSIDQMLVKAGRLASLSEPRHATSFCVDSLEHLLCLGLDDGTLFVLNGPSAMQQQQQQPQAPPFQLLAVLDVKAAFAKQRLLAASSLNVSIDNANVRTPVMDMAFFEISSEAMVCLSCPLGYAFVRLEQWMPSRRPQINAESVPLVVDGSGSPLSAFFTHVELNTATGDGIAPASAIGGFGTSVAWHAFAQSIVMRMFVPKEFGGRQEDDTGREGDVNLEAPSSSIDCHGALSSLSAMKAVDVANEQEEDGEEALAILDSILRDNDSDGARVGWAGVMRSRPLSMAQHHETRALHCINYDEPQRPLTRNGFFDDSPSALENIIRATIPLSAKYTAPLELVGGPQTAPETTAARKPPTGGAAGRVGATTAAATTKPLVSATTGRPLQGSVTKPVTFGRPIKGSGYGANSNAPWSIQQEQKKKKAAAAAQRAKLKPEVVLGQERPAGSPLSAGNGGGSGLQYVYDVAKSTAPINPKAKSNEIMAKPQNRVHAGAITALTYNASATAIITGSSDATLHVLKCPIATHKGEGRGLRGHGAPVLAVDVSLAIHNHPLVASGARDGCVAVWCPSRREAPLVMENVAGPKDVNAVKFFYQDKLLAAAVGSQIKFFRYALDYGGGDLDRGRNLSRLKVADQYRTDAQAVTSLDCANSFLSTVVVWAGSNKQFGIVDIAAQRTVRQTEEAHTRSIHSLVLAAANSRFASPSISNNLMHCCATAALDKTVKVWDLRSPAAMQVYSNHMNLSQQVGLCFSPCGNFIVVGSEDRSAFVYDTRYAGGNAFVQRLPMPDVVTACRYHPLEPVLALGTASGDIRMFGV